MERKEAIRGAYRMTGGNSFYDGMITCSTLSGKAVYRLVWIMNKAENDAYLEWLLFQPSEEILNHTYEYTVREDILLSMEYNDLPDAQAKRTRRNPLTED